MFAPDNDISRVQPAENKFLLTSAPGHRIYPWVALLGAVSTRFATVIDGVRPTVSRSRHEKQYCTYMVNGITVPSEEQGARRHDIPRLFAVPILVNDSPIITCCTAGAV